MKLIRKKYSDVQSIDHKGIVLNDGTTYFGAQFEQVERDITATPPYFRFQSPCIELRIDFDDETGLFSRRKNLQHFQGFHSKLQEIGVKTLDLS